MAATTGQQASATAIREFRVEFPDEAVDDLRRRIVATRFPDGETVKDDSQGVPLALMQDLASETDYRQPGIAHRGHCRRLIECLVPQARLSAVFDVATHEDRSRSSLTQPG